MVLGEYVKLNVIRKTDLGYMLGNGKDDDVLLHFKQSLCEHKDGDEVTVFLYADKAKRLTATENKALATINTPGFVEVVEVLPGAGVFVSIGTPKDILLSKDYLPYDEAKWPVIGDKVFIRLKVKHDILAAKPLNRFDIKSIKNDVKYTEREVVDGFVCHIAERGIGVVTLDTKYVYIPYTQLRGDYRMGEAVSVTITKENDGEYYGTMNAQKEILMDSDKEIILEYLKDHHGVMKLTAKSSAEEVEKLLKISRKAFKRAYGALYKEHVISFDEEKTILNEYKN